MIPDEAVEAAAKALYFYLDEDHRAAPPPWESLDERDEDRSRALRIALVALEAAAPHIEGAAHNRGWRARYQSCVNKGCR